MLSRRRFLTSTAAAGVALATPPFAQVRAQQKRLIVDAQIHMWPANTTRPSLGSRCKAAASGTVHHRAGGAADGRGRCRARGDRAADAGRRASRLRAGGGETLSRPLRHHGAHCARPAGARGAVCDLARPAGRAWRAAELRCDRGEVAHRWHGGLVLAGGGEGQPAGDVPHDRATTSVREHRRAASAAAADHRPHGRVVGDGSQEDGAGNDRAGGRARQISQRVSEALVGAADVERVRIRSET